MIRTVGLSLALAGSAMMLGTGCMATTSPTAHREVNQREDFMLLEEKLRRVEGDMETLTMQLDLLRQELQRVQANSSRAADSQTSALRTSLGAVEDRMLQLETRHEAERKEIIDTLSRKVAELVNAAAPQPAARSGSSATGFGYEHVVQPGETLSRIAQAYGTTVSAIMAANNIQNPDSLQVGQTLFIPE